MIDFYLLDTTEELLAEVKNIESRVPEICEKLAANLGRKVDWDEACKMAARFEANFPAVTGNLESDSYIAFMVATQPHNPKFVGMRVGMDKSILPVTKENYSNVKHGTAITYLFSRDDNGEYAQMYTHKQTDWIDTPSFSGFVYKKDKDPDGGDCLTLMKESG